MDPATLNILVGVITLVVTQVVTLLTLVFQGKASRDRVDMEARRQDEIAARDRQWAIEDRKGLATNIASTLQATSGTLAAKVDATAAVLAQTVAASQAVLVDKIDNNTQLTQDVGVKADAAYNEANNVNKKIQSLTQHAAVTIALRDAASHDVDAVVTAALSHVDPLKPQHENNH